MLTKAAAPTRPTGSCLFVFNSRLRRDPGALPGLGGPGLVSSAGVGAGRGQEQPFPARCAPLPCS